MGQQISKSPLICLSPTQTFIPFLSPAESGLLACVGLLPPAAMAVFCLSNIIVPSPA